MVWGGNFFVVSAVRSGFCRFAAAKIYSWCSVCQGYAKKKSAPHSFFKSQTGEGILNPSEHSS